jgi:hypothetical protein
MIQWLGRLLYESTPAEFRSAFGMEESVERLQAATKRSAFSAIGEAAAVGKVSPDLVRLQRVTPMVRNSFKPFFVGRFESRDGITLLTGQFGMSLFTKIFMTFWLGMVALFGISCGQNLKADYRGIGCFIHAAVERVDVRGNCRHFRRLINS